MSEDDLGYLGFNKAFSAPAEAQGQVWRHCVGCESQILRVALRFGFSHGAGPCPLKGNQRKSEQKSPGKEKGMKKTPKKQKPSKMTENPCKPTPPFLFSMVCSGCFGGICFHSAAGPPCHGGAEPAPSPRAVLPSGLRWLQSQPRGWAGLGRALGRHQ